MATNFYHAQLQVHFGNEPAMYLGYYVSTSSSSGDVTCFKPGDRATFEEAVAKILKQHPMFTEADPFRVAAAATFCYGGDNEDQRDWGGDLLPAEVGQSDIDFHPYEWDALFEKLDKAFQEALCS